MKSTITKLIYNRSFITGFSGLLILAALGADHLAGLPTVRNALMIAAAIVAGSNIAIRAWNSLLNKHISIELLVTIAATGALFIGEYWESAAVTFLFMLGAWMEARTMNKTRQTLQKLIELAPDTALVLRNGTPEEIPAHELQANELVLVRPGSKIPVDGTVEEGTSSIDESPITGESIPVEKAQGSGVYAGTINQNGLLKIRANKTGADTTLAGIIRRVEEAQEEKAPTQRFIERFAQWYTPAILIFSGLAFLITGNIVLGLTLLVIGCPGALVISTPVSIIAGIGRAAQKGILIKGGDYLETAGKVSAIAFDKTGTLTKGEPQLTRILAFESARIPQGTDAHAERHLSDRSGFLANYTSVTSVFVDAETHSVLAVRGGLNSDDEPAAFASLDSGGKSVQDLNAPDGSESPWNRAEQEILYWAAIAETGSEHPLAKPILEAAKMMEIPQPETFTAVTGKGIQAVYGGHTITVGTERFFREENIPVDYADQEAVDQLKDQGITTVLVALNRMALGAIGISDTVRDNAAEMIRELRKNGIGRVLMLTGDNRQTAEAIAKQAGIDEVHAGLLPEDKLRIIRDLRDEGHVTAMAGDGINDAPALAAADIGIAMGLAGTDVAIETADIALMSDDLMNIPEAIRASRKTMSNIKQNVMIALLTVAGLLGGVILGKVHMAGGMLIHELSVLVVVVNGMRLLRI